MSCTDQELGEFAISAANPAGLNPRDGDSYLAIQAEVDKLSSIHVDSPVDWPKVASLSAKVLREEGKDINVAVWFLCALTMTRGVPGLELGIKVLRSMLETFWVEMTPPPTRLRARRNQAEWLLEWLNAKLEEGLSPVPAEQVAALLVEWEALDKVWNEQDAEGPSFFRLRRRLAELPVEAQPEPTPAVIQSQPTAPAATVGSQSHANTVAALPIAQAATLPSNLDGDEAVENAINAALGVLAPLVTFCLDSRSTLPLLYRLNRQMAWMTLEQAPPAQANKTRLPAPAESQVESFTRLQTAGEVLDILRFCEGNLSNYPFWLDLNRVSHAALMRMGASAAAATVAEETRQLLSRLPTLAELSFADGQPFADGATQNWLDALAQTSSTGEGADVTQGLIDDAGHTAAEGKLTEAMAMLQSAAQQAQSGRNRFRLRAAQIELLHRFDSQAQLGVALDVLLREAQQQKLHSWEPELVLSLLGLAVTHEVGGSQSLWAEQLVSLDLPAFLRLSGAKES
jgi:type VI secretion system protein VasJ